MTGDIGFIKPAEKIVAWGRPPAIVEREIETVANMYAGRLCSSGTTANEIIVGAPATKQILGWLGYEDTALAYRPLTVDTIYAVNDRAALMFGGGFGVVGSLTPGVSVVPGDFLAPWVAGELIPVIPRPQGWGIKIPYAVTTGAHATTATGVDIPLEMLVSDAEVIAVTTEAAGTIDVGFENAVESGDLDGLLVALPLAATGLVNAEVCGAAASPYGVHLATPMTVVTSISPAYPVIRRVYEVDRSTREVVYNGSAHNMTGFLVITCNGVGFEPVARAVEPMAASTSSQDIMAMSLI
jgi:hypothetical protein